MVRFLYLFVLVWCSGVLAAPDDFAEAKRLARKLFPSNSETFYCGCRFKWQGDKAKLDLASCQYQVRKNVQRANRLEWEHVVPAHQFAGKRRCWQTGGREFCQKNDELFRRMEADLYNLRPAVGEVNGDRAHYRFTDSVLSGTRYGQCDVQIDSKRQLVKPKAEIQGDIARIYFYMRDRYQLVLSDSEIKMFNRWHLQDPVDAQELQLNSRIARLMGWENPYVTRAQSVQLNQQSLDVSTIPQQVVPVGTEFESTTATGSKRVESNVVQAKVLGNKRSKKYHLPHCSGYSQVSTANQQWFSSEQQARDAGYQRAGNCPLAQDETK